ncbi:MAG TPA: O-antigen ligase family protein [Chthoniobacterales bacterium]
MRDILGERLIQGARLSFLIHIIAAAVAYGLTREDGIHAFNWTMGITIVVWILGCLIGGKLPKTGIVLPLLVIAILALGWAVTIASWWDPTNENALPAPEAWSDFIFDFATFDYDLSVAAMVRTSVLLGTLLLATDLFAHPQWTRGLFLTIAVTATGMVIFFFLQKIAPGTFRLRSSVDPNVWLSFATYRYWGNGASFLNLMWPALAGIGVQMALTRGRGWSIWLAGALLVFAALYVNLSKAGQALGVVGLIAFVLVSLFYLVRNERQVFRRISWPALLAGAIPLILLFAALPIAMPWNRWNSLMGSTFAGNDRLMAYRLFVKLIPDAGWTGFGAGTFRLVHLQYFSNEPNIANYPFWVAHEDYIQTLVEWGYIGTAFWGLILITGTCLLLAGKTSANGRSRFPEEFGYEYGIGEKLRKFFDAIPASDAPLVKRGAFVAIMLTALHAAVDFPMQIVSIQFYFLIWVALGWRVLRAKAERRRQAASALSS